MYLEISKRQCGKTTRLLSEVQRHLSKSKTHKAIICGWSHDHCNTMKYQFIKNFDTDKALIGRIRFMSAGNPDALVGYDLRDPKLKACFDEFDIYPERFWSRIDPKTLKSGYFCTTPLKRRTLKQLVSKGTNDIMVKLLRMNKYDYVETLDEMWVRSRFDLMQTMPQEVFEREVLGKII